MTAQPPPPADRPDQPPDGEGSAGRAQTTVSIVVPCYNEEATIAQLDFALQRIQSALRNQHELEYILVDDGSRDATWRLLEEAFRQLPRVRKVRHPENQGIAAAIQTGLQSATAEIVISLDADGTYEARELPQMLAMLESGFDLVTASPYHPQGTVQGVPRWRLAVSRAASAIYRLLLRTKLHCYTSCFRVYRRSAAADVQLANRGFVGIAELVWKMDCEGARIGEYPAILTTRTAGHSKLRLVTVIAGHLRLMVRILGRRLTTRQHRCTAARPTPGETTVAS